MENHPAVVQFVTARDHRYNVALFATDGTLLSIYFRGYTLADLPVLAGKQWLEFLNLEDVAHLLKALASLEPSALSFRFFSPTKHQWERASVAIQYMSGIQFCVIELQVPTPRFSDGLKRAGRAVAAALVLAIAVFPGVPADDDDDDHHELLHSHL